MCLDIIGAQTNRYWRFYGNHAGTSIRIVPLQTKLHYVLLMSLYCVIE